MAKTPRQQVVFEDAADQALVDAYQETPHDGAVAMDAPPDAPTEQASYIETINKLATADKPPSERALEGEILTADAPTGHIIYRQRIRVVEAWQYKGKLAEAPPWIDRNWAAWGDYDPVRGIQAGPAVRVPDAGGYSSICRIGDFIVQEEVAITDHLNDIRVTVWPRENFEKMFMPVSLSDSDRERVSSVPA